MVRGISNVGTGIRYSFTTGINGTTENTKHTDNPNIT